MPSFTTPGCSPVGQSQLEVLPSYPRSGWVEHDPDALIGSVGSQVTGAMLDAGIKAERIAAIGLTNQRETTIVWDASHWAGRSRRPWSGKTAARPRPASGSSHTRPMSPDRPAWSSIPTSPPPRSPGFSTMSPMLAARAQAGELAAGTVDSFVIWHLTGGERFVTDATNASRTLLMDLHTIRWAPDLCELFGVPPEILPKFARAREISA